MDREEFLAEVDAVRAAGHTIGFVGSVGNWTCDFNGRNFQGTTPMEAYLKAKETYASSGERLGVSSVRPAENRSDIGDSDAAESDGMPTLRGKVR